LFLFLNKLTIPLHVVLRLLSPEGDLATIVHGDLHNNNMMFLDQEEPVVFKLFDWQMVKVLGMS
jgi:aminoglycoside phosphotransferase (APT) family kinase protein